MCSDRNVDASQVDAHGRAHASAGLTASAAALDHAYLGATSAMLNICRGLVDFATASTQARAGTPGAVAAVARRGAAPLVTEVARANAVAAGSSRWASVLAMASAW